MSYKEKVAKRNSRRGQITKIFNDLQTNLESKSKSQQTALLQKLDTIQHEVNLYNNDIFTELCKNSDESALTAELENCSDYEDKLLEAICILKGSLDSDTHVPPSNEPVPPSNLLKGHHVPLPVYSSGEHENFERFILEFESCVNRYNHTDFDKLQLLKAQINGRAKILIDTLEFTNQSYDKAKDLLIKALASPLNQKYSAIKQMSELRLSYGDDPFAYIGQFKMLMEMFDIWKIDAKFVLQYFFWEGLNTTFKDQIVQVTNEAKPSLDQMLDNFFVASERYMGVVQRFNNKKASYEKKPFVANPIKPKAVANFAIDVKPKFRRPIEQKPNFVPCSLCASEQLNNIDHTIFKCVKYPDANSKYLRLRDLNACTRCASNSHTTNKCNYKFKNSCKKCAGWHFDILCVRTGTKPETSKVLTNEPTASSQSNQISSGVVRIQMKQTTCTEGSLLPTFSALFENRTYVRILKDSGCQTNFISSQLAQDFNLNIIKQDVKLNISGFNQVKEYITNVVEFELLLGSKIYVLDAVCVPSIGVELSIPGLGNLVAAFKNLGFDLADRFLSAGSDSVSNLDLIVGTDSSHIFEESSVLYGNPVPSVYYKTQFGALLVGNVSRAINNIQYLKPIQSGTPSKAWPKSKSARKNNSFSHTKADSQRRDVSVSASVLESAPGTHIEENTVSLVATKVTIVDSKCQSLEADLNKAAQEVLNKNYMDVTYDPLNEESSLPELDEDLIRVALSNASREADGRLKLPLLWNGNVSHLLGSNRGLAEKVLKSNLNKLKRSPEKLKLVDEAIREWEDMGIVQRIPDLDEYIQTHPNHSFLSHMPIFKLDRQSSKCRVVFLSNLSERSKSGRCSLSHNQAMYPGPSLNKKLSTSLFSLRFDKYIFTYDLVKAFLQISLSPLDQDRLLFLWYANLGNNNYKVIGFKNLRLTFGLVCSPFLLMIGLYKILIEDAEADDERLRNFKRDLYDNIYMDNGGYTTSNQSDLEWAYHTIDSVFNPYQFALQQMTTNFLPLQAEIDAKHNISTDPVVKLFGHFWNRENDTLFSRKLYLDENAATKRSILSSIAKNYDIFNFNAPILNRARVFMHNLQLDTKLDWDSKIKDCEVYEWKNIAKQVNNAEVLPVPRYVGDRNDPYRLFCFTDSSKVLYGCVVYMQNLRTLQVSFLTSKNRIVNKNLETKTIPNLELQAVSLGVETLFDIRQEISGSRCIKPIQIDSMFVFTDSLIALNWINSFNHKMDKIQKRSVFAINRLCAITKLCSEFPVSFNFIAGQENPADLMTRPISYKLLLKTSYLSGPSFLTNFDESFLDDNLLQVLVPNPLARLGDISEVSVNVATLKNTVPSKSVESFIDLNRFSSLSRAVSVTRFVLKFIDKLKSSLKSKNPDRFGYLTVHTSDDNLWHKATLLLIKQDQKIEFPEVYNFFCNPNVPLKDVPDLISRFNVFVDQNENLRLRAKMDRGKNAETSFPIFLPKKSKLTSLIVESFHIKTLHGGCYVVLNQLRKEFFIQHSLSVVKKILKSCVNCRRSNGRTVKLNASPYREFRLDPPEIPFRYIFLDYFGPYKVKFEETTKKVWILLITCLYSRAINLVICHDMTTKSFLRAMQLHILDHGVPALCLSDMGSQIVPGTNSIKDSLNDVETRVFLETKGIKHIEYSQYAKGCHPLGGLVEVCIRAVRKLLYSSIKNNVLDYFGFEFFVKECMQLINRRPIAFKDSVRDGELDIPQAITPEMLLKGYEPAVVNIIPEMVTDEDEFLVDRMPVVDSTLTKLGKIRKNLIDKYHTEFITTLISQSVNQKNRYLPISHVMLQKGDIVLIKDPLLKFNQYPMGIIREVETNQGGEVTSALVFKGTNRETVRRHVNALIPLLQPQLDNQSQAETNETVSTSDTEPETNCRPKRKAAEEALQKLRNFRDQDLI